MGTILVTPPAFEPVSLAEARDHCRQDSPVHDGVLAGYILAARQYVEKITGRVLATQTWDHFIDRDWPFVHDFDLRMNRRLIELPHPPCQSVTSITYVDSAGNPQTLSSDYYLVDTTATIGRIEPAYGVTWPAVRSQSKAITVRYIAGHGSAPSDTPEPIRQAMLLLIGHWFENRETVVVGTIAAPIEFATSALLAPYRMYF